MAMNVAHLLRHARRQAGLTQRALAEQVGMAQPAIARIESGAVTPRADTLVRLLAASGYELALEPRLGIGVDRTLIRDRLKLTPRERIRLAVEEARMMPSIRIRR